MMEIMHEIIVYCALVTGIVATGTVVALLSVFVWNVVKITVSGEEINDEE